MRSSLSVILSTPAPETTMSHPDYEQISHDHCSLLILVKNIGGDNKSKTYNRMFDRICRTNRIRVIDSSGITREIWARYIKEYPVENNDWGDFQTHRRLLGLLSVGKCNTQVELNELCRVHESFKVKYGTTLFDSRCIVFGLTEEGKPCGKQNSSAAFTTPSNFKTRALYYPDLDNCLNLETQINEFLSSLFWVLESKRQERSREKVEKVALLLAPFEKKDFVGLDLESRANKRRCVGRMTKHLGDLSLQAGLPAEALGFYHSAADILRGVYDWLWLGAALEGLCAASVLVLYPQLQRSYSFQRNSSLQEGSPIKQKGAAVASNSLPNGVSPTLPDIVKAVTNNLPASEIPKHYREAILHYSKYQNAGIIETEACFKAARIAIEQRMTLLAATILQNVVFINLQLSEHEKILRFTTLAELYTEIGFHRKASFCCRLAATRLVSSQNPTPDWFQCYNYMLKALSGHKISLDPTEYPRDGLQGWSTLQIQLLQELATAAKRTERPALASRHMTFLLQTLWFHLSPSEQAECSQQLKSLASLCEGSPVPLVLESGIIIPPANLTNIPLAKTFQVQNLQPHLRPQKIEKLKEDSGPFLFTPINFGSLDRRSNKSSGKIDYFWVEEDICQVSLKFFNPLPFDLKVSDMRLLTSGIVFESIPTSLLLPKDSPEQTCILSGIPKEIGTLEILGYSTHTLGVKSNCKLKHIPTLPCPQFTVEVIPALPQMNISSSLSKSASLSALGSSAHVVTSGSLSLFAGQSAECTVTLKNIGQQPVELLEVSIQSVLESELQTQTFQWSEENLIAQLPLRPESSASFTLYLYGTTDFLLPVCDESSSGLFCGSQTTSFIGSGPQSLPSRLNSPTSTRKQTRRTDPTSASFRSTGSSSRSGSSMRLPPSPVPKNALPNSSRVIEGQLKLRYSGGPGLEAGYCRMCSMTISLDVSPSLHVTSWEVLPAETSNQFYLVLDIVNMTNYEMDLQYTPTKCILIEANESCRVPLPVARCPLSKLAKLYKDEIVSVEDRLELDRICSEHISSLVDLKWTLPAINVSGKASLTGISLTNDMLDIVRLSPVQWDISVNGEPITPQEELRYSVGDCLNLEVTLKNFLERPLKRVVLELQFYQDLKNGNNYYRLDTRLAYSGADKVLIPVINEQASVQHEFKLVFFTPGQYKVIVQCRTRENFIQESNTTGHLWKNIPPLEITISEGKWLRAGADLGLLSGRSALKLKGAEVVSPGHFRKPNPVKLCYNTFLDENR